VIDRLERPTENWSRRHARFSTRLQFVYGQCPSSRHYQQRGVYLYLCSERQARNEARRRTNSPGPYTGTV